MGRMASRARGIEGKGHRMELEWGALLIALLAGLAGGCVGALTGVGGGILFVPIFALAIGLGQKEAVATSAVVIVATGLSASLRNQMKGELIHWQLALATACGAILAAYVATGWMHQVKSITLSRIFAGLLIVVGLYYLVWPPRNG